MPLQKQSVALPLLKGVDLSVADSLREPDSLSSGKNIEQLKTGEITKRAGFVSVEAATSTPYAAFPINDSVALLESNTTVEIFNVNNNTVNAFNPTCEDCIIGNQPATVQLEDLIGSSYRIDSFDTYYSNGIFYVGAFNQNNSIKHLYKFDENLNIIPVNGAPSEQISSSIIRDIRFTAGFIFFIDSGFIKVGPVTNVSSATNLVPVSLHASTWYYPWDVAEWSNGGYLIVYFDSGNINIAIYDSSHVLQSSTTLAGTNLYNVTIFPATMGSTFCVGVTRSAGNYTSLYKYDNTCTLLGTADSTIAIDFHQNLTGIKSGDDIYFASEYGGNSALQTTYFYRINEATLTGTINLFSYQISRAYRCGLGSKFYKASSSSNPLVNLIYKSTDTANLQNTYFIVQIDNTDNPVHYIARMAYGYAPNYISLFSLFKRGMNILPQCWQMRSGEVLGAISSRSDGAFSQGAELAIFGVRAMRLTLDTYFKGTTRDVGAGAIIANNGLFYFNGGNVVGLGFPVYPDPVVSTTNLSAGNVADGTYSYILVFESIDSQGNIIRSAPSVPYTAVYSAGSARKYRINFYIPPFFLKNSCFTVLYRTLNNGTIYYRVDSRELDYPSSVTVSIDDDYSDATIATKELLYTTGNIVENIAPSNVNFIGIAKNRAWTFETGVSDILWFSKEFREGFQPEFSDLLTVNMGKTGGPLVGTAAIDDKVLVFKQYAVYVLFGDGPTGNLVGEWSSPTLVVQGMGCVEARSILETTQGVIYQSQEGLYLIDKSLQNQFIGRPLYKNEGTIRAAVYDASKNCCYFLTTNKLWVFYFTNPAWYEWTVTSPIDLVLSNGTLYLTSTTKLLKQTAGTYQDDSVNYEQSIKLGQFQFAGLAGYQRLYRLLLGGAPTTDANSTNITANVYINNNTTATDTKTIAHNLCLTNNRFELEIRPSIQKCETLQLELTQTSSTSGYKISSVTAEVGAIPASGRRSSERRI